jgi:amidase
LAKSEWSFKTAVELSSALAAKQVSAVELAQDAIGRIERHDGKINAICVRDFARGLDAARAADAARGRGEARPLLGLPPHRQGILQHRGVADDVGLSGAKGLHAGG